MEYYIQGDAANAEQIRAALKEKGISDSGNSFIYNNYLYFTKDGETDFCAANGSFANIIKTHPDYKELELPSEPKFKVNAWIISNITKDIYQVKAVPEYFKLQAQGQYRLQSYTDGSISYFWKNDVENTFRLWTTSDIKDGDVLMTLNVRNCPFIYRKTDDDSNLAHYYAGINGNGGFCEGCLKRTLYHFGLLTEVIPANKGQRDLLFAKMKEAGYQWDEKKKELKKIVEPKFAIRQIICPTAKSGLQPVNVEVVGVDVDKQCYTIKQKGCVASTLPFKFQDMYVLMYIQSKPHYDISNFKPFDKVLVRDRDKSKWGNTYFGFYDEEQKVFVCDCCDWEQCIPFNGDTKHLLGTTDMPSKEYINW